MSTILRPAPRDLADVRDPDGDDPYPIDKLAGCRTGLVLFAAAWHGRQDAVHLADAGIDGWCVDIDGRKLREMEAVYPFGWQFVTADVFEFAVSTVHRWDVVSADPFTGDAMERCVELVPLWCLLASRVVVLGTRWDTKVEPPPHWRITDVRKRSDFSGGIFWTVLEPA